MRLPTNATHMNAHEEGNKEGRSHLNSYIRIVYLFSIRYGKQCLCLLFPECI